MAVAFPHLQWETGTAMVFSIAWLLFISLFILANWQAWWKAGTIAKWQKEYRWRIAWLKRRRQKGILERS